METRNWKTIEGFDFKEILFEEYNGIAKITINRPRYRNAFTPRTTWEMSQAFAWCREAQRISVVILTGAGDKAFCSGGDMHVKGRGGYVGEDGVPRLNVLDVQKQIRSLPKPVIAMVNGYAIGGGHVLHLMCDLTIASDNAIFGQEYMETRNWKTIEGFDFKEILFEEYNGIAKITINRPRYRNAFTPRTTWEMSQAFAWCREAQRISVVILTGAGDKAFCSGGDMHVKGRGGYVGEDGVPRLNVLDVQKQIRSLPKPVIAMVNGYAIGGGHVLHLMCDLTIASDNAIFGQTGPKVGSFDAGFGASYLARIVGQKKAREIWFLCRQYSAVEAERMGMVNKVVPFDELEDTCVEWAETMMERSPLALRMIKAGLNAELDGQAGIQELAGDATMLYYMLDEAQEGGKAFLEKRKPDFSKYPKLP